MEINDKAEQRQRLNVCMIAYSFYESDNRVLRYARTLATRGDCVDAIALRKPGQASYERIDGVNVYRIQERTFNESGKLGYLIRLVGFLIRSTVLLTRRHLANPFQLIHIHSIPDFLVFAGLLCFIVDFHVSSQIAIQQSPRTASHRFRHQS